RRHDLGHCAGDDAPVPRLAAALGPPGRWSRQRWCEMTTPDPQARPLLEAMQAAGLLPLFALPVADARRARRRQLMAGPPRVEMVKVEDDRVPGQLGGIPLRWCRPSPQGELPVTVYFHGSGWTVDNPGHSRPSVPPPGQPIAGHRGSRWPASAQRRGAVLRKE